MNLLEFDEFSGQAEDDRARNVRKYLTTNGWKYTSRHPGSHWMWSIERTTEEIVEPDQIIVRTVLTYVVNESTALQFQRYWELDAQNFNAHDADCPIFETFKWEDCNCIVHDIEAGTHDADGVPIEDDIAALDGDE